MASDIKRGSKKKALRDEARARRHRIFSHLLFELLVRRSKGESYQDLFNLVMTRRYPSFRPMEPYGNLGDRKNDGYIPETGVFFQVYAPSDPATKIQKAAQKAADDFQVLLRKWNKTCPIKEYRFAFNNEYGGSNVPLEDALAAIAKKYKIKTAPFLTHHLEDEAMQLPAEKLQDILEFPVPEPDDLGDADYTALKEVIEHVMKSDARDLAATKLIAPKFEEKIKFNGLSADIADLLRASGRQTEVVSDFFSLRPASHKQDLRDHLASIYEQEKRASGNSKVKPDTIFVAILSAMTPPTSRRRREVQSSALVVMAYYFEACDVFEAPDALA